MPSLPPSRFPGPGSYTAPQSISHQKMPSRAFASTEERFKEIKTADDDAHQSIPYQPSWDSTTPATSSFHSTSPRFPVSNPTSELGPGSYDIVNPAPRRISPRRVSRPRSSPPIRFSHPTIPPRFSAGFEEVGGELVPAGMTIEQRDACVGSYDPTPVAPRPPGFVYTNRRTRPRRVASESLHHKQLHQYYDQPSLASTTQPITYRRAATRPSATFRSRTAQHVINSTRGLDAPPPGWYDIDRSISPTRRDFSSPIAPFMSSSSRKTVTEIEAERRRAVPAPSLTHREFSTTTSVSQDAPPFSSSEPRFHSLSKSIPSSLGSYIPDVSFFCT